MPALRAAAGPRAHPRARVLSRYPLVCPECQGQGDRHRTIHEAPQQPAWGGRDHRATAAAPIPPQPQDERFRGPPGLPGANHRSLPAAVPHQSQRRAQGRSCCVAAGTDSWANCRDRRGRVRPKFDVDLEIRDPLLAPLPIDGARSTTGTTIGVGSPSPFLSWPAPRRCTASMTALATGRLPVEQKSGNGHGAPGRLRPITLRERKQPRSRQLR